MDEQKLRLTYIDLVAGILYRRHGDYTKILHDASPLDEDQLWLFKNVVAAQRTAAIVGLREYRRALTGSDLVPAFFMTPSSPEHKVELKRPRGGSTEPHRQALDSILKVVADALQSLNESTVFDAADRRNARYFSDWIDNAKAELLKTPAGTEVKVQNIPGVPLRSGSFSGNGNAPAPDMAP